MIRFQPVPAKWSFVGPMFRLFRFPGLLFLLLLVLVGSGASYAQGPRGSGSPSEACLVFKRGLSLGAPLAGIKAKLQAGKALTIVALGSSSTTGFGTGSGGAFPDVMKGELLRLRPSARIELINSGRIMDNIPGNVGRLESDVLSHKPDLVVWQLGSNDAVWRGIAGNVKEMITDAVKRLKAANSRYRAGGLAVCASRARQRPSCSNRKNHRQSRARTEYWAFSAIPSDEARDRRRCHGAGLVGRPSQFRRRAQMHGCRTCTDDRRGCALGGLKTGRSRNSLRRLRGR